MSSSGRRQVVVWRRLLLKDSETFIRNQTDALSSWHPVLVGMRSRLSPLSRVGDRVLYASDTPRGFDERILTSARRSWRLRRVLMEVRPSLVHAHFLPDAWLVSGEAARLGIPLIVTVHGYDVTQAPSRTGMYGRSVRRQARQVLDQAARVIAVSEFIRSQVIALGADPSKVVVHHIGIPIPDAVGQPEKSWDIAFVGRFVEKKGVLDLIDAIALLAEFAPRCVFIGAGQLFDSARTRAAAAGIDATFLGTQPPDTVRSTLLASRVFAAPSKTASDGDSEGLPITVLEAAAAGVAIASTFHSGIPEAVVDGETGLLSPEGDVVALSKNIARLLASTELREVLGKAARERLERDFDIRRQSASLEMIYDDVVAERSSEGAAHDRLSKDIP